MEFLKLCGTRPAHAYSICFNQSEEASGECSLYVINIFWAFLFRLFFCIYNHLSFSATRSSGLFQARNKKQKQPFCSVGALNPADFNSHSAALRKKLRCFCKYLILRFGAFSRD